MKYSMITILAIIGIVFSGCGMTSEEVTLETSQEENSQTSYQVHNQGKSCAHCHSLTSFSNSSLRSSENENEDDEDNEDDDTDVRFTSGVTLYDRLDSTRATQTYILRLLLTGGEVQSYQTGKGTGNFHGTFNSGIDTYTPQILDAEGNIVKSSLTDSHDATRFNCNRCHTVSGANGASGRVYATSITTDTVVTQTPVTETNTTTDVNTSTPTNTTARTFAANVLPILSNQCASCHGSSGNFSITQSASAYAGVLPYINTTTPTSSSLLLKASGGVGHGGGVVFSPTSSSYNSILSWINAGGLNN